MTTQVSARRTAFAHPVLLAFLGFVVLAGGAAVAIRATYAELAPFWAGAARFLLAALIFWALAYREHLPLPKGAALWGAVLFGILTVGFAFLLAAWALKETPASRYQILVATVPLLTIFLSSVQGVEALSVRGLLGTLLAVGGIVISVGGAGDSGVSLPHVAAALGTAACLAQGGILIKKLPPSPPIMTNAIATTTGGLILALASLASGERWIIPVQPTTWIAYLYLAIPVTVVGFLLYIYVVRRWHPSEASYAFVLNPLVTIVFATTLAGEQITLNFLGGAALVLAGVYVGSLMHSPTKPHVAKVCKEYAGGVAHRCA